MGRVITYLPKYMNPVEIIHKKMFTCPICGGEADNNRYNIRCTYEYDSRGKHRYFFTDKNYRWERYPDLVCKKCGCKWDTGWFPADNDMFKVTINSDKKFFKNLANKFKIALLSDEDFLKELENRFGKEVRSVVENMINKE